MLSILAVDLAIQFHTNPPRRQAVATPTAIHLLHKCLSVLAVDLPADIYTHLAELRRAAASEQV